jgi:hypothetical protein
MHVHHDAGLRRTGRRHGGRFGANSRTDFKGFECHYFGKGHSAASGGLVFGVTTYQNQIWVNNQYYDNWHWTGGESTNPNY